MSPYLVLAIPTWTIVLIVIAVVLIIALVALSFWGRKQQKKMDAQKKEIDAAAQTVSILVIDKKMMRITEAGLPKIVVESTPKLMRRSKVAIVKAKIGPKVMTLIADNAIFNLIPVKQEVKATISGIYITQVRGLRGPLVAPEPKKGFFKRLRNK